MDTLCGLPESFVSADSRQKRPENEKTNNLLTENMVTPMHQHVVCSSRVSG